uniref:Uncharacterized protein n=1 Tax=Arundo donax TaxID=35708 RepID=A0A0A9A5F5_ARUDO
MRGRSNRQFRGAVANDRANDVVVVDGIQLRKTGTTAV